LRFAVKCYFRFVLICEIRVFMKTAAIVAVSLGLVFSSFGTDTPSVNAFTETLSRGPWAELPQRVVALVRHAKPQERQTTTIVAVKAALGLNPAAATAVVGAIARALPDLASLAAETAAADQPKQAPEIALAAAAGAHSAAADIVVGVCRSVPAQYESVALAVSSAAPKSGKEILKAITVVQPGLKQGIDSVVSGYGGRVPSVALVLAQAQQPLGNSSLNGSGNNSGGLKIPQGGPQGGDGGSDGKGPPHFKPNPGHGGEPPGQYKKGGDDDDGGKDDNGGGDDKGGGDNNEK
jgi:hypothetical protein